MPNPNLMMVATSFGFGILVLAQIFGPLSSAHINCAVSFGLFLAGRTSAIRAICYTLSQMLGSVFGALFLWAIFGSNWPAARAFGSNSWDPAVFRGDQVFFAEMLGTALLMFNVLSTIDIPKAGGGPLGVYPIAMSVMIAHLFLLPIDGCSINPTRSFGPSVVSGWAKIPGIYQNQQAVFWFGPLFGAGIAACLYEYGSLKPESAGVMDMDKALFEAGVTKKSKKKRQSILSKSETAKLSSLSSIPTNEISSPLAVLNRQQQQQSFAPIEPVKPPVFSLPPAPAPVVKASETSISFKAPEPIIPVAKAPAPATVPVTKSVEPIIPVAKAPAPTTVPVAKAPEPIIPVAKEPAPIPVAKAPEPAPIPAAKAPAAAKTPAAAKAQAAAKTPAAAKAPVVGEPMPVPATNKPPTPPVNIAKVPAAKEKTETAPKTEPAKKADPPKSTTPPPENPYSSGPKGFDFDDDDDDFLR